MDNDPITTPPGGQLYGFPPVYYPGAPDLASAAVIELTPGQIVEANLALTRQPYYPVKIPVANGEVNGMNVSVEGLRGPGYSLGYNATEEKITGLLPNGNYLVEGATYGVKAASGKVSLAVSGGPTDGPAMTLVPASSISFAVTVEFNDNQPTPLIRGNVGENTHSSQGPRAYLAQAHLENAEDFERPRGGGIRPPTGPDDDSLVIENVLPGRYWLRLYPARGYVASAAMGGNDVLHEPVSVGSGSNTPIEVKLRDDFAEIDGTVTNLGSQALLNEGDQSSTDAWVYFVPLPDSPGEFKQIGVSSDGKFASPMMVPGSYRVLAFASQQPNLPYRDPVGMKAYETKGQVITVAPEQKATIRRDAIRP